jgi:porphobilinogen deaminase
VKTLADKFPDIDVQIIEISTHGDRTLDKPLSQLGGKGAFVAEIEQALLDGKIDAAVHSAKDMPIKTADGTSVAPRRACDRKRRKLRRI